MHRLRQFIIDVHRRSLWQVLGIYLVGSYVGYEVVNELTQGLALPDWVPGFAVVLFVIGLPIVLATAFVQEGLPGQRSREDLEFTGRQDPTLLPGLESTSAEPATAVVAQAKAARGGEAGAGRADHSGGYRGHWLLTWQRAVLGGIVAFLLLGITAGGYMGMRSAGIGPAGSLVAKGALDAREPILLAAFEMPGGDSLLAATVTEAFRVDFEQSPIISVVDHAFVRSALVRMDRPLDSTLDFELAREMAEREGLKAVLNGEIRSAGGSYMLTVRLAAVEDGSTLASFRETAADSTQILATVDLLSKKMRNRIGESLRTIRSNAPLEAVTTPSLQALRKYTQAVYESEVAGDYELAALLLRDALELDSTFAMAWRKLAVAYGNSGRGGDESVRAATRAYELRDRLTERERQLAAAYYHTRVSRDLQSAVAAYRALLQNWPDDRVALNNIGILYTELGQYKQAVESLQRRIDADSSSVSPVVNLIMALAMLQQSDSLEAVIERGRRLFPAAPTLEMAIASVEFGRGDYEATEAAHALLLSASSGSPFARALATAMEAALLAVRGSAEDADRLMSEFGRLEQERGASSGSWAGMLLAAQMDLALRREPDRALRRIEDALRDRPLTESAPLDRPYLWLATLYARAGDADRAREMIAAWEGVAAAERLGTDRPELAEARAWLRLAEGDADGALRVSRQLDDWFGCGFCRDVLRASAFEAAGSTDSAIVAYERALGPRIGYTAMASSVEVASIHERLAELYESVGARDDAVRHAAHFTRLWQDADAELQPRVRAKQQMLARLTTGDGGR